ncbi:MAG: NADH:flavin oxidoreductase [Deltaproteobacteria bacterium]|jgi:2,4-dienoyl-CoA reductase-like NADH-dependent reductase (Old Yellow Enzyme family)|nr:NADH:flavin oxidoreductase [Deltaproteobacteria bacterium]
MSDKIGLYDPWSLGPLTIKNRLVRSATFEFAALDGRLSPAIRDLTLKLAAGGSGLIITGMAGISKEATIGPVMVDASHPDFRSDLRDLTTAAAQFTAPIMVQLNHSGYRTRRDGDNFGVSELVEPDGYVHREATIEDIQKVVTDFASAALRCQEGGAAGVQIHAAHGFLIATFLSPATNQRSDGYGGPIANRARILLETYAAVRAKVGPDYPVAVKLHFSDGPDPSITPDEVVWVSQELAQRGLNMIEVSSGVVNEAGATTFAPLIKRGQEGPFLSGAALLAEKVQIPVVSVCGYRTPDFIAKALNETKIAAVSLCRPLIREPDLPNRWRTDRSPAKCVSCGKCFNPDGLVTCRAL